MSFSVNVVLNFQAWVSVSLGAGLSLDGGLSPGYIYKLASARCPNTISAQRQPSFKEGAFIMDFSKLHFPEPANPPSVQPNRLMPAVLNTGIQKRGFVLINIDLRLPAQRGGRRLAVA